MIKADRNSSESFIGKLFPKNFLKTDKAALEYFTIKLFLVASCGPVLLLLIMFGLGWIHELSGGGEWGLGTLFGFIVLPITIIAVAVAFIFAIILSLIIRKPALIILTLQALGIFIAAADMGSYMSSIFDMTSILPYLQYLVFALSSIFVFMQYLRKNKERSIDSTSSVE
ncbi:MAG: hypothetical protein HY807_09345 [Nitrospirae bacterium]|nr:hypothetical protein [Nitrospirota bacterium]